jgi:hypothetical protein
MPTGEVCPGRFMVRKRIDSAGKAIGTKKAVEPGDIVIKSSEKHQILIEHW